MNPDKVVEELHIKFKDCTIDITGDFFKSTFPVFLEFDNCVFIVASTKTLINLDYSDYDCEAGNHEGKLLIKNSVFKNGPEGTLKDAILKDSHNLFNIKSSYDITIVDS